MQAVGQPTAQSGAATAEDAARTVDSDTFRQRRAAEISKTLRHGITNYTIAADPDTDAEQT